MEKKYSDWMKIDLHIHSDFSRKTKNGDYNGNFSIDKLHERLTDEKVNVELFSITDHNIINLEAYKDYYKKYDSENDPLLLTGIELDIKGTSKRYHSILIFNCCNYKGTKEINDKLEAIYQEKGHALTERYLDFDDIIKLFGDEDFFFIPHAGNTSDIIHGYKGDIAVAQKMLILLQSPLEKVPEKKRQIYNEGFDTLLIEKFKKKENYAYIEFSDNHYVDKYPCVHMGKRGIHEFYYIKGSKNYETLRLAFIDPKSRIKSPKQYESMCFTRDYVESLRISGNGLVNETELHFSPHFNAIIGGRSSGKSLLMNIMNKTIDTMTPNEKYIKIIDGTSISISSKNDETFKEKTHINSDIIQINQGDIVKYFEDNQLYDLAKKAGKATEYNDAKKKFEEVKNCLSSMISKFNQSYSNMHILNVDRKLILHDRTIKKLLTKDYHFKLSKSEITKAIFTTEQFDITEKLIEEIETNIKGLKKLDTISMSKDEEKTIDDFSVLLSKKKQEQTELRKLHTSMLDFTAKVEENISKANSSLNLDGQEKSRAAKYKEELEKSIYSHLQKSAVMLKECIILNNFSSQHFERIILDEDAKLCLELSLQNSISEAIVAGIKIESKTSLYIAVIKLLYKNVKLKIYSDNSPENFQKKINSQLKGIYHKFESLTDYLEYSDGSNSKNNSPGYNSEKYLNIVLNNSSYGMIIIDQPEDNLGSKFISNELVDLIREIKVNKQIFLITHNPAIVVYGDAESIIIAENKDNSISYRQVKLEEVDAQKEICEILDGGEYIFDNRAKKYNIQRLLQEV